MTNVYAFSRVHYGGDYLGSTLKSTQPFVRQHLILYTAKPTFGRETDMPNPDSRDDLFEAVRAANVRVYWLEGVPIQVETALANYTDADILLELDADEVIQPQLFDDIVRRYEAGKLTQYAYRVPFLHHWRSFNYACEDSGWPIRLYLPKAANRDLGWYNGDAGHVHHFGYARKTRDMQYKWETSVHIGELRPEWWSEIWAKFPRRLNDVHPVCRDGFWNARAYDKTQLPEFMHSHPYFDMEVIE